MGRVGAVCRCLGFVVEVAGHDEGVVLAVSGEEAGGERPDGSCFRCSAVEGIDGEAGSFPLVLGREAAARKREQFGLR